MKKESKSLSEKRKVCVDGFFYYGKDVKEFIKNLKDWIVDNQKEITPMQLMLEIDKLAGPKLIK